MHVVSDDERRRVAERLRELGKLCYAPGNTYELMIDALGVDDLDGTDDLFDRLADLIEPDESGHESGQNRDSVQKESPAVQIAPECDREALLALADDLDYAGAAVENVAYIDQTFHESARRIREALGVVA